MISNPIIRGFNPDPSITCAGDKFYIVNSTFEWWPGARLYVSEDLANWEDLGGILTSPAQIDLTGCHPSCGVWACDLSFDGRRFYLTYTDVKTKKYFYNTHNYLIYSESINGPWSKPVYLNSAGFDPSVFHDTDGRKYLVGMLNGFKGITVQSLDPVTLVPVGDPVKIFEGSGIGCTEGPHLYKVGEYYYLITAEGGTGYDHCVSVARSRDLYGPYKVHPDNPILTSNSDSPLQKCGHGDIVFDKDGRSYIVFLCSRPVDGNISILGRETAIEELVWEDGWPRLKNGTKCAGTLTGIDGIQEESDVFYDDFSEEDIKTVYSSPRRNYHEFTEDCTGQCGKRVLRLTGRESINSFFKVSLLSFRIRVVNVRAITRMHFSSFSSEQMAGLCIVYDALNNYMFVQTSVEGRTCLKLIRSDKGVVEELETITLEDADDGVDLSIEMREGKKILFGYRTQEEWVMMDSVADACILSDEYCRGFTGTQIGMYVHDLTGSGAYAEFEYFKVEEKT